MCARKAAHVAVMIVILLHCIITRNFVRKSFEIRVSKIPYTFWSQLAFFVKRNLTRCPLPRKKKPKTWPLFYNLSALSMDRLLAYLFVTRCNLNNAVEQRAPFGSGVLHVFYCLDFYQTKTTNSYFSKNLQSCAVMIIITMLLHCIITRYFVRTAFEIYGEANYFIYLLKSVGLFRQSQSYFELCLSTTAKKET